MMADRKKTRDDPDAPMTALIGAIGVFIVFLVVLGVQALFYHVQQAQIRAKNYGYAYDRLASAHSQQLEDLNRYAWINQAQGTVSIPIDRAMMLATAELQRTAATQPFSQEAMP